MADPVKPDDRGALENTDLKADDVFDTAFDQAAQLGDRAELSPADDPKNMLKEEPPPVVVDKTDQNIAEPVEEKKEDDAVVDTKPVVDPSLRQPGESDETDKQRWLTLQGIHKKDKETFETERTQLLAQIEELQKPPAPAPEKKPETIIPADLEDSLSEEDKAALKEYDEEFDIVSKMEGKKRDIELRKLEKRFQSFTTELVEKVKAELSTQLMPATELVKKVQEKEEIESETLHFKTIRDAHPDFEKYRDDSSVIKWIESKPKYMQRGMMEVYGKGSADDVVDLFNDYKTENNIPNPQPVLEPTNVVNIDTKKEEKKQALRAVTTRRGAVNASMSVANDFEGAWDERMNKEGG